MPQTAFLDRLFSNPLAGVAFLSGDALPWPGAPGAGQARQGDSGKDGVASMDSEDFAAFYHRSARPLWAYLARVSADPALADDLLQEAYIRFLGAENAPPPEAGEVAQRRYLYRIATNLLRDHWRKPRPASIEDLPESSFSTACSFSIRHENQALLAPAMARLTPRERQLLWLAHAEGYSHREIAGILGLASASIRLLLFRARRKMAALLREPAPPAGAAAVISRRQP